MTNRRRIKPRKGARNKVIAKEENGQFAEVHGLYSKLDLSTIDGRTRLGKIANNIRSDLQEYVGDGTAISGILIEQILYKFIRISMYQANQLTIEDYSEKQHYIPLSNSLRLDLQELARQAGEAKPPSLEDYLSNMEVAK